MTGKLTEAERYDALADVRGWTYDTESKSISRSFKFKDFTEAFDFMTKVAKLADGADHHPDWSNSYNRVDISLSTHDAGGLTQKDVDLATAINAFGD